MPDFDMPATGSWEQRGGWVVRALMRDLDLTIEQAGGIVGNLGFESAGFTKLHEVGQPDGVGGYGWGQWTADRRELFFDWCMAHGFPAPGWQKDEANYGFLLYELRGAYRNTIDALRQCATLEQAVFSVGETYERPAGTTATHMPGYDERLDYARRAVTGARDIVLAADPPDHPPPPVPYAADPRSLVMHVQSLLGVEADGIWGPHTQTAYDAWREAH
jgi:hypothetical protein